MKESLHIAKYLIVISGLIILFQCKGTEDEPKIDLLKKQSVPIKNEVPVMILNKRVFKKELVSNGRLEAVKKSELRFNVSEKLRHLYVKNGSKVKKGQILASLDKEVFEQKVAKAELELEQSTLEFNDLKIRRGFDSENTASIPEVELNKIAIKSGYKNAQHQLKTDRFNLESTTLRAPFSGKVANIKTKIHEQVNSSKPFLTLINDSFFEVAFYLIESELKDVKLKDEVTLSPFATSSTYEGSITSINPQVEKEGTILVRANVKNDGQLLEGMNVKVFIQKDVPGQYVIPKSAVVLRDNQEVLFKVQDGKAYWTYIQTVLENSKHYTVIPDPKKGSASLAVGDTIIVAENLNLAHESEVIVKPKN